MAALRHNIPQIVRYPFFPSLRPDAPPMDDAALGIQCHGHGDGLGVQHVLSSVFRHGFRRLPAVSGKTLDIAAVDAHIAAFGDGDSRLALAALQGDMTAADADPLAVDGRGVRAAPDRKAVTGAQRDALGFHSRGAAAALHRQGAAVHRRLCSYVQLIFRAECRLAVRTMEDVGPGVLQVAPTVAGQIDGAAIIIPQINGHAVVFIPLCRPSGIGVVPKCIRIHRMPVDPVLIPVSLIGNPIYHQSSTFLPLGGQGRCGGQHIAAAGRIGDAALRQPAQEPVAERRGAGKYHTLPHLAPQLHGFALLRVIQRQVNGLVAVPHRVIVFVR